MFSSNFQVHFSTWVIYMLNLKLPYFLSHMVRYFIGRKKTVFRFLNNMHYMVRVNLAKSHYSICFFNPCLRNLVSLNMISMSCWIQVQKMCIHIYCLRIRGCLWKTQAVGGTYQILFWKKFHKLVFSKKMNVGL